MTQTPKPQSWEPGAILTPSAPADRDQRVRVRFGQDYTRANPYQTLLYRSVLGQVQARSATPDMAADELAAQPGQMIYHLHWEEHDLKRRPPAEARHAAQALLDGLDRFADLGGRIVWTRHNARPHDPHCAETYAELTAALSDRADVIHCHSWGAVDHLAQTGPLDMAKTVVIAHGSYCGHYRGWPRRKALESFGFPDDAHVFLLAGRLAGYKRIRQSAEGLLRHPAPHIRLLIAGADPDAMLDDLPDDPRLSLHRGFVNDAEIGRFHAAADTALLPYAASLSSGQAILAAGFGTGILGSDTTGLRAVVTPGVSGTLFDPDAPDALDAALERAVAMGPDPWRRFGQAGAAAAARRDWAGIGRLWAGLFTGLAAGRRAFDPADAWIGPAQ